jgi:hypothetical protein
MDGVVGSIGKTHSYTARAAAEVDFTDQTRKRGRAIPFLAG